MNEDLYALSLVIPAYNEEDYIANTLESVLSQSHPADEIILVANACTDNTAAIAKEILGSDHQILQIPEPGISHAKNYGAHFANGRYLAFLDADTIIPNRLFEHSICSLEENNKSVVYAHRKIDGKPSLGNNVLNFVENQILLGLITTIPRGYLMSRRGFFDHFAHQHGVFDESLDLGEDLDFGEKVLKYAGKKAVEVLNDYTTTIARREEGSEGSYFSTLSKWAAAYVRHKSPFKSWHINYSKDR